MDINKIAVGKNPPHEVNVIIEVAANSQPVKYEYDKESGALFVDRFLQTSMMYPCSYGFIPHTLSGDGDPCDVLVISDMPIIPGAVIPARPIGVLLMEDESGIDEKIIALPTAKANPYFKDAESIEDMPEVFLQRIQHFFEHYKDLDKGKWVKVQGFAKIDEAHKKIQEAIDRYQVG